MAVMLSKDYKTTQGLAQVARCMLIARAHDAAIENVAERLYGESRYKDVVAVIKSAIDAHGTTGTGAELFSPAAVAAEFAKAIRPLTVLGKLRTTKVPFVTSLPFISTRTTFGFVEEHEHAPATNPLFGTNIQLKHKKVSGIVVLSRELLESSQGEQVLREEMEAGAIEAMDRYLLDAQAATDGRPAAINYDPLEVFSGGGATDAAGVDALASAMLGQLIVAGSTLERAAFVTTPQNCAGLSLLRDPNGGIAYPGITVHGGTLAGIPILASASAPSGSLTLVDGGEILVADDDVSEVRVTDSAFINQDDDPDSSSTWISLFQADQLGLKLTRYVNWQRRRDFCVYATGFNIAAASVSTV